MYQHWLYECDLNHWQGYSIIWYLRIAKQKKIQIITKLIAWKMKEIFEFETIMELNNWFRTNIGSYTGYYYEQYKDASSGKWILSFVK